MISVQDAATNWPVYSTLHTDTATARGARTQAAAARHQGAAAAVALCVFRAVAAHCTEHCAAVAAFRAVGVLTD